MDNLVSEEGSREAFRSLRHARGSIRIGVCEGEVRPQVNSAPRGSDTLVASPHFTCLLPARNPDEHSRAQQGRGTDRLLTDYLYSYIRLWYNAHALKEVQAKGECDVF